MWWASEGRKDRPPWLPIVLHCLQMGVLWRYARLLVPVELRRVKHQVRDLCKTTYFVRQTGIIRPKRSFPYNINCGTFTPKSTKERFFFSGMLRLVHAFCEAAPMLLLQLHILLKDANLESTNELVGVTPEPTVDEPSGRLAGL